MDVCRDNINPTVHLLTEKLRIDDKNLLKIEVPRSLFVHESSGRYFIRQGSSKRRRTTEQLGRLLQSRSQARIIAFDEQFVPVRTLSPGALANTLTVDDLPYN